MNRKKLFIDSFVVKAKGPRPYMEDRYVVQQVSRNHMIAAVFDGHGGYEVAEMCANLAPQLFADLIQSTPDMSVAVRRLYKSLDGHAESFRKDVGCTAAIVILNNDHIVFSNCGDAMIMMKTVDGKTYWMSQDHKVENEKTRVQEAGGTVTYLGGCARINHGLNIARSIGDHYIKNVVISDPYIMSCNRHRVHIDYIVVASDGLWDVFTKEEFDATFTHLLHEYNNNYDVCLQHMIAKAYQKGSMDNITILFCKFMN